MTIYTLEDHNLSFHYFLWEDLDFFVIDGRGELMVSTRSSNKLSRYFVNNIHPIFFEGNNFFVPKI